MCTPMKLALCALVLSACAAPMMSVRPPAAPHGWETFAGSGGVDLFGQYWKPESPARGVVIIQHGLKDHGSRYAAFAERLVAEGYAVYAMDLRGHGRSAGRRVTIDSFDEYLDDFDIWVRRVKEKEPGRPVFLFGHSMGGVMVTLAAMTRQADVAGIITSAPALRVDLPPIVLAGGDLLSAVFPNLGALAPANADFSSDPAVVKEMGEDPLIYQDGGPARTASELFHASARVWAGLDRLTVPCLFLHGTGDVLTSPLGSRELYRRAAATDKTLRLYDGLYHDLVHEPGRQPLSERARARNDATLERGAAERPGAPSPRERTEVESERARARNDATLERGAAERPGAPSPRERTEVEDDVVAWLNGHTGGPAPPPAPPAPELPEPSPPSASSLMSLRYARTVDADRAGGAANLFAFDLRNRFFLGSSIRYCLGLDAEIGATSTGVAYEAEAYLAGVSVPFGRGSYVSLCAGAGLGGIGGALPFGWQFPVEAGAEVQVGPIRLLGWAKATWVAGADARKDGSDLPLGDEFSAGAGIRIGGNTRYWADVTAGAGVYIGATYRRLVGTQMIGVVLGTSLWGGR